MNRLLSAKDILPTEDGRRASIGADASAASDWQTQFHSAHVARTYEEEMMTIRRNFAITTILVTVAGLAAAVSVRAGGDKVAFPADYAKGVVYMTLDRPENKQVREYFTSQAAVDAAKKGDPLPQGTVITVGQYAPELDAQGNPGKDPSGRFSRPSNI